MIIITNGTVHTMVSKPIPNGIVLIKNNKIKQIYKSPKQVPKDIVKKTKRIINANGGWIFPGLIESHCHIGIQEDQIGECGNDLNEFHRSLRIYLLWML